jgi:hypothetical protein
MSHIYIHAYTDTDTHTHTHTFPADFFCQPEYNAFRYTQMHAYSYTS